MIPKIIHQAWFGPGPIPDRFHPWMESIKRYHPGWHIFRWQCYDRILFPAPVQDCGCPYPQTNYSFLNLIRNWGPARYLLENPRISPVVKSDIFRFEILKSGGFWLDYDVDCVQCLDQFCGEDFVCGWEHPQHKVIGTAILGACPDSEVIHWLAANAVHNCTLHTPTKDNQLALSGPNMVTAVLRNEYARIVPLRYQVLYPIYYDGTGMVHTDTVTRHWWNGLESDGWTKKEWSKP